MNLLLTDQTVTRVSFDHAVTLLFDSGAQLGLGVPFSLRLQAGSPQVIDPEQVGPFAADVLSLLHQRVQSVEADDTGVLRLRLESGCELVVQPHEMYEAWSLTGPEQRVVVALPGGGLSTWA